MQQKKVETMAQVDLRSLRMPMVAVYNSPEDFPGYCVARVYDMNQPTDTVMVKKSLREVEEDLRKHTDFSFLPRGKEDVASLAGVWM